MSDPSKSGVKAKESKQNETSGKSEYDDFEWLQYQDTGEQRTRLATSLLSNPFVPLGALATVVALTLGLYHMRKQDTKKQQFYMRARVGAQGFTIASLLGGLFYQSHKRDVENQEKLKARTKLNQETVKDSNEKTKS